MPSVRSELEHAWGVSAERAAHIQTELARHVVLSALGTEQVRIAAGVDVGYSLDGSRAWACAVSMDSSYRVLERTVVPGAPDRTYSPGLLAFREGRLTVAALTALEARPDLVFCDGHGIVHERGLGLASHIGVLLDIPTIGVTKTPFHSVERLPETERGSLLVYEKEWGARGAALRLRTGVKPVYVSPGHLVDLESAIAQCLGWSTGHHKVPEPLQAADTLSRLARQGA